MSVIVSDSRNPAYDTNWSTANTWYRAEAHNLAPASYLLLALSTNRAIDVTFANAGNFMGVGFYFANQYAQSCDKGVEVHLQEKLGTCTISIASPGVITLASHGLINGDEVAISTSGALPTGLSANTRYYVVNAATNTFELSLTLGGASINTSGSQSGTHTLWVSRDSTSQTADEMTAGTVTDGKAYMYELVVPFIFSGGYTITTAANTWRFLLFYNGGSQGTWSLETSDLTHANMFAWCDNQLSYSANDTAIIVNKIYGDGDVTLDGVTSTGYSTYGIALVIARSDTDAQKDNVANLLWHTPSSLETLTIKGKIISSSRGGIQIGSSSTPIPAGYFRLMFDKGTYGSYADFDGYRLSATTTYQRTALLFYGEAPTAEATLTGDVLSSATSFAVDDASDFTAGDVIIIGKRDYTGYSIIATKRTIDHIVGNTIYTTTSIGGHTAKAGGKVVKVSGYGITIGKDATVISTNRLASIAHLHWEGVALDSDLGHTLWYLQTSMVLAGVATGEDGIYGSQHVVKDCFWYGLSASGNIGSMLVPEHGLLIDRLIQSNGALCPTYFYGDASSSGELEWKNSRMLSCRLGYITLQASLANWNIHDNIFNNSDNYMILQGNKPTFKDNIFWGCGTTSGTLRIGTLLNIIDWSGNTFDKGNYTLDFAQATAINCKAVDDEFGQESANVYDIDFGTGGTYFDFEVNSPTGTPNILTTNLDACLEGSKLRVSDSNNVTNTDYVYTPFGIFTRTGYGLGDTTVWTGTAFGAASAGEFGLKMTPTSSTQLFTRDFFNGVGKLIGNQQNKTLYVRCRVKINNANFYAGTHTNPTLRIVYDDGTESTDVALDTTDEQELCIKFSPTTTYQKIELFMDMKTDATGTDRDVYIGEAEVTMPDGVSIDNTRFSYWANALPLPPNATMPTQDSILVKKTSVDYGSGSFGEAIKFIQKVVGWLRGLI